MTTYQDASEIVTGLVIQGRLAANSVNPASVMPPYDELIKQYLKSGGDIDTLIENVGLDPVQNALHAAETINGTSKLANFVAILERTRNNYLAGEHLEKVSHKLLNGETVDWSKIASIAAKAQAGIGTGLTSLDKITAMEIPFKKTGFVAIDEHFGGIPGIGQTLIGASSGAGKTTFMLELAWRWAKTHKEENVVIFTLEMMKEELKMRLLEVCPGIIEEEMKRIFIEDAPLSPEETVSVASTIEKVGLVCIDFADLLVPGEMTESAMGHIYRTFMMGAKSLRCAIVVLCQFNRGYTGGIPRPFHIRYTGSAEQLAWAILMLYNPNTNWFSESEDDNILPPVKNQAYIIGWKFRGGYRTHPEDSPGAIQIGFKGNMGWDYSRKGIWFPIKDGTPTKKKKNY